MNALERKTVAALAGIFALRMSGLFLLLPVLAPYAAAFPGGAPFMVGLALGVYGATQGALQIPFGLASDRFGRKGVITFGLLIFAIGGVVAATADSIYLLIIGRAVQGAGAVSGAALALTADVTREKVRTTAFAIIGVTIGAVFLLSLIIAPPLQKFIGIGGIFWLSAALGIIAIGLLWFAVPAATPLTPSPSAPATTSFSAILKDRALLQLNFGAFALHGILTALFVALPAQLILHSGMQLAAHWKLYAPVLIMSAVFMAPMLMLAARHQSAILRGAIGLLFTAALALTFFGAGGLIALLIALWIFFTAFNVLEAMLPSLVSKLAPANSKGAAIGVFSTFQFLGMFAGGICAGAISQWFGAEMVFWFCAALAAVWFCLSLAAAAAKPATEMTQAKSSAKVAAK